MTDETPRKGQKLKVTHTRASLSDSSFKQLLSWIRVRSLGKHEKDEEFFSPLLVVKFYQVKVRMVQIEVKKESR